MYTAEIYKQDRRTRTGERLITKGSHDWQDRDALLEALQEMWSTENGYRVTLQETMVTRTNAVTGEKYQERYDTPRSCSPASELFWSM